MAILPTQDNIQLTDAGLIGRTTAGAGLSSRLTASAVRSWLGVLIQSEIQTLIDAAVAALVASAPGALDTLDELAAALGDDANFAATVTALINAKYTKPGTGIPKADLVASVQTSLGLADTAAQLAFGTVLPQVGGTSGTSAVADQDNDTLTLNFACGANVSTAADALSIQAHGVHQLPYTTDSTIYLTPSISGSANATLTANRLYHLPFRVSARTTFTTIAVAVTTAVTSTNIRLGVRNMNQLTAAPTTLVSDCGTVSSASTGTKTITGLSITLDPGWYYFELVSDGSPAIRGASATGALNLLGTIISGTSSTAITYLYRAFTYAALPSDETGQSQTADGNVVMPIVGVR